MDFEKLGEKALGIVKALAPLVGMTEEVEALENIIREVEGLVDTIGPVLKSDDQEALNAGLADIRADAKAKIKRATDRL